MLVLKTESVKFWRDNEDKHSRVEHRGRTPNDTYLRATNSCSNSDIDYIRIPVGFNSQEFSSKYTVYFCCVDSYSFTLGNYSLLCCGPNGKRSACIHFFADISNEFFREMVMNAFLYYPLGLALSVLIGLWSIPLAFMFSVGIETWQYFAGTGLAQGTDVICNTLGCAIGALPFFISKRINRK